MDREAFAELLPEKAPYNLISWVRETQSGELGGSAYTVYRCERAAGEASMMDLFENRIRGRNIWATACTCTECGEVWLTRKGATADSFFVMEEEDGGIYTADPEMTPEDAYAYMDMEVTEGDSLCCPICGEETIVMRAKTIGNGKTKRLQIAELTNIDGYTTTLYWLAENHITQYGAWLELAPRYAYALDEKGKIRAFSHRQSGGYAMDAPSLKWRPVKKFADKWNALYYDWQSINGRKGGSVGWPRVPEDMAGTTGEKTGLAGYWAAVNGELPLQYLKLWQKCPAVENLVYAGFHKLLGSIIATAFNYGYDLATEAGKTLDLTRRKPHELMRLSKEDYRSVDHSIRPGELRLFQRFRTLEPGSDAGKLWARVRGGAGEALLDQIERYGGSLDRYDRYFEKQRLDIRSIGLLADARKFAQEAHPQQKLTEEELWPQRLQQTHDRLSEARLLRLDADKSQKLQAGFDAVLQTYGGLQWTDGDLEILLPKSNLELVREGQVLRHCVGGYGNEHAKGEKIILFVRHHRRPERSYYTLNISFAEDQPREIQLHGYGNERHGKNKQHSHRIPARVRAFVDRWEREILVPWFIHQKKEKSA